VLGVSSRSSVAAEPVAQIECRAAGSELELAAHFRLRRAVFVHEQRLFSFDDRDDHDEAPRTVHGVGLIAGEPRGAVRLYPLEGEQWKGDRLAVSPDYRTFHLGAELVRFAVATAGALGGGEMIAHIQLPNVRLFEHLGWRTVGDPAKFHGVDHQLMSIPL
jgi:putative N-acetyltransferase (TIGR04045 family)